MKIVPPTLYQITGRVDVSGSVAGSLGLWFVSFRRSCRARDRVRTRLTRARDRG
jgi:hypothetical protein